MVVVKFGCMEWQMHIAVQINFAIQHGQHNTMLMIIVGIQVLFVSEIMQLTMLKYKCHQET